MLEYGECLPVPHKQRSPMAKELAAAGLPLSKCSGIIHAMRQFDGTKGMFDYLLSVDRHVYCPKKAPIIDMITHHIYMWGVFEYYCTNGDPTLTTLIAVLNSKLFMPARGDTRMFRRPFGHMFTTADPN